MLKSKKIAITGGLASGKSTLCDLLKEEGACVTCGDAIAHHLLEVHQTCIEEAFGTIDRAKLAKIVFEDREKLEKLEAILHPPLLEEIEKLYLKCEKEFFFCEIPILFEKGWETRFDKVIATYVPDEVAKQRYIAAGHTAQEYETRMQHQLSPEEKAKRADHVIDTSGTIQDLKSKLKEIIDGSRE